ncbi:hypothetical protein CAPTEDRAFT_206748 [Capitella teleta]|uniref:Uncharacterized protein n=1 Tax=Capitella teleta TaxID=283909 RepID=R7TMF5_CAPTE|nr:hypothetical protein CAPTEDRAFT_206748 [Capitella teleta]|eukprot:ELT95043.1 hypothetical protein CAPTEDRAFT_206748 [Capitella teleta]
MLVQHSFSPKHCPSTLPSNECSCRRSFRLKRKNGATGSSSALLFEECIKDVPRWCFVAKLTGERKRKEALITNSFLSPDSQCVTRVEVSKAYFVECICEVLPVSLYETRTGNPVRSSWKLTGKNTAMCNSWRRHTYNSTEVRRKSSEHKTSYIKLLDISSTLYDRKGRNWHLTRISDEACGILAPAPAKMAQW